MTAKAYSYKRFSSAGQKMSSIERQEKVLADANKWCAEMGIPLDTTLSYVDLKTSAYRGKNRDTGALGDFLRAIETGKVQSGDYLIVEELSRLTRMEINLAQELFLSIVNSGVKIVSLIDRKIFSRDIDPAQMMMDLIISISMLSASHLESFRKSKRGKEFYKGLRADIQSGGKAKVHLKAPWWIAKHRDKDGYTSFTVIEERAELVREIFRLAAQGMGPMLISRHIPLEVVESMQAKDITRHLQYMLANRLVLGLYQPCERVHINGKEVKQPVGPEVRLYPQIVSDELWYKVQDLKAQRHRANDFKVERVVNIFGGVLKCCECGTTLRLAKRQDNRTTGKFAGVKELHHYLMCPQSYTPVCGYLKASYTLLEPIILEHLRGLDTSYLLTGKHTKTQEVLDTIAQAEGKAQEVQGRINTLLKALESSPDLDTVLLGRIKQLNTELEQHRADAKEAGVQLHTLQRQTDTDIHSLIDTLNKHPEDDILRGKLKTEVQRLIDRIEVRETKLKDQHQTSSKVPVCLKVYYKSGNIQAIIAHKGKKAVCEFNPDTGFSFAESTGITSPEDFRELMDLSCQADISLRGKVSFSPYLNKPDTTT